MEQTFEWLTKEKERGWPHKCVQGRSWEQKSTTMDVPKEARKRFTESPPSEQGLLGQERANAPFQPGELLNQSVHGCIAGKEQWSPSVVDIRLTLILLPGTAGQRDQPVADFRGVAILDGATGGQKHLSIGW